MMCIYTCYLCCTYSICDISAAGVSHHCRKTYRTEIIEQQFHKWFILVLMNKEKDKRGSKKDKRENNCELHNWPLKPSAKYWIKSLKFSSKKENSNNFAL